MSAIARFLAAPSAIRIARILVGLVLLAAAFAKIGNPAALATQITHYRVLPVGPENLLAVVLPWIELLAGLALVSGFRARSGAWLALAMMVVFTAAVGQAMARGLDVQCGCFGAGGATRVGAAKLIENLALTAAAALAARRL